MLLSGVDICNVRCVGRDSASVPVLGDIRFDSPDGSSYHSDYTHSRLLYM